MDLCLVHAGGLEGLPLPTWSPQTLVSLQATVAALEKEVAQLKEITMASNTTSLHLSPDKSAAVVSVSMPTGNPIIAVLVVGWFEGEKEREMVEVGWQV